MSKKKRFLEMLNFERVEAFFALTYEYQDETLWNLAGGDKRKSKNALHTVKPVVFYDARKTRQHQSAPLFLEHQPIHHRGLHHSKAFCLIEGKEARLFLGSANLTFSGLTRNRETLGCFSDKHLLGQFYDFLKTNYSYENKEGNRNYKLFLSKLEPFKGNEENPNIQLLTNGYGSDGILNLRAFWKRFEKTPASEMLIVSPFLDKERLVIKNFEESEVIQKGNGVSLVTSFDDETNFPLNYDNAHYFKNTFNFSVYSALKTLKKGSNEWQEIVDNNKNYLSSQKDVPFTRPLHSKVLLLKGESGVALYIGSGNFTSRAWKGLNRELGVVQYFPKANFEAMKASFLEQLGAQEYKLNFENIPKVVEFDPDEKELEHDYYPAFINSILMKYDQNYNPYFVLDTTGPISPDYEFEWGANKLLLEGNLLKANHDENFGNLLKHRHITAKYKSGEKYYIPYKLADEVVENAERLYFKSSDDWLAQFGKREAFDWDYTPTIEDDETGLDDDKPMVEVLEVDRNDNFTIKMQQYLNYLTGFEKHLSDRVQEAAKLNQVFDFREGDPNDFPAYVKFLITELKTSKHLDVEVFKLGEISQILKKQLRSHPAAAFTHLRDLILNELKLTLSQRKVDRKAPFQQYLRLLNEN